MTSPNKYPGPCTSCGQTVPAGTGGIAKVEGRWTVHHTAGCPSADHPVAAANRVRHTPTAEQAEAVRLFLTGQDLVIEAGAGCTKTSTLVMCAEAAPERTGQYLAFSRSLVDESAEKFPGNVRVSTVHALAYAATVAQDRRMAVRLKEGRQRSMDVAHILGLRNWRMTYGTQVKTIGRDRLAGMVLKAVETFCQSADPAPLAKHIPYVEGIDLPDEATGRRTWEHNDDLRSYLLPFVVKAWADLRGPTGDLSWAKKHCYYLKAWDLAGPAILADFILVDEAQDLSGIMLSIVRKQTCQKVYVGDSAQAIFGFLGCVDALAIARDEGAAVARLSKSFRFGAAIADVANGLLGRLTIDLRLTGNEAVLSSVTAVPEPNCILTRTNAAAVRHCLTALDDGKRPALVGGAADVVAFAEGAMALQSGQPTSHSDLACFDTWAMVESYVDQDEQGEDLRLLVKLVAEFTPQRIIEALGRTVREADADVVVSTAHKAKGREWNAVQIANDFRSPRDGEDLPPDELKLLYVACTRAKRDLDVTACPQALGIGRKKAGDTAVVPLDGPAESLPSDTARDARCPDEENALALTARFGTRQF